MRIEKILAKVDHTLLSPTATWEDILVVLEDAIRYKTASVCIPPSYVDRAFETLKGRAVICTVIGFPLGYQTTEAKVYETVDAINNGADEIDMVINISDLKNKKYDEIKTEISTIKEFCGDRILKVIIETALLTEEEKIKMCEIISEVGADYIKTSTGFAESGAKLEDIILFKKHIAEGVKIKAAGGISSLEDAEAFIEAGADRLGTSRIVKIAKGLSDDGSY